MAQEFIKTIRVDQKTLDCIETIKAHTSCVTNSEAIRVALYHYATYVSKKNYELEVYKYAVSASSKFARKKGIWDEWYNAVYGNDRAEAIRKFKRWRKQALEGAKTENKGETK
jgi:hypothetical protein